MQRSSIRKETLETQVYQALKRAILERQLVGGERLVQDEMANTFGTSRIPVRDALKKLEVDGLVTVDERGGYFVSVFGREDLEEIYAVRALLEPYAAVQATSRLSAEDLEELEELLQAMERAMQKQDLEQYTQLNQTFHFTLYEASRARRLVRFIKSLWSGLTPLTPITIPTQCQRSFQEHQALLKGLQERDVKTVEEVMRAHVQNACASLLAYLYQDAEAEQGEEESL